MSIFKLEQSLEKAEARLGRDRQSKRPRRKRSDAGQWRLPPAVIRHLRRLLGGQQRPPMRLILRQLREFCSGAGFKMPSRATIYKFMAGANIHEYTIGRLGQQVQQALYNLDPQGTIPGHQLVFYCFNYGDLSAVSFAAGLPWIDLYQAAQMRGWRAKSRGLLEAVLHVRGI
jgi:hypothetical protein